MTERGTAKELNLQVGDIVTWGMRLVDVPFNPSAYWNTPNQIFTLISRAKKSIESNELTWGIAGLSLVCKTIRSGFDSLPCLHFYLPMYPKINPPTEWRDKFISANKEISQLKRGKK